MSIGQVLIIDGDDTLWENNVYLEKSIEGFIDFVDHASLNRYQEQADPSAATERPVVLESFGQLRDHC